MKFFTPGSLIEAELELVLRECYPGNPQWGWMPAYRFDMRAVQLGDELGNVELRVSNDDELVRYAGHLAYTVKPAFQGNRLASRACRLLLPLARRHGFTELWITCNPDNWASRKTCEALGAVLEEIVRLPPSCDMYLLGEREKCRYKLTL